MGELASGVGIEQTYWIVKGIMPSDFVAGCTANFAPKKNYYSPAVYLHHGEATGLERRMPKAR